MDVSNQTSIDAFLRDPLSADQAALDALFDDAPKEGVAVVNAENELRDQLEVERQAAEASEERARGEKAAESPPATDKTDDNAKPTATQSDDGSVKEATADPENPEQSVILAKDGKNVIPYSVLAKAREREAALQSQLTELSAKAAALEEQVRTGKADLSPEVAEIDAETLKDLEENAPSIYKVVAALQSKIQTLSQQSERVAQQEQTAVAKTVQETIDANPKIAFVQANDVEAFNAIAGFDAILRNDPKFAGLSLDERFGKALAMYESAHGPIALPASASGKAVDPPAPTLPDPTEKAAAALEKAAAKAGPNTLSDIPGGEPPGKSSLEDVEKISAARLTNQFLNMTKSQLDDYLARLG